MTDFNFDIDEYEIIINGDWKNAIELISGEFEQSMYIF